ncbi:hypothetical protein AAG570_012083 [Ranatra chinensis]|uniref:Laminin N-terminal domain-containing protein n=1 Tax=Ranatra chinensis TaxID=642074 RepID=A0ABD0YU54_9HEMI
MRSLSLLLGLVVARAGAEVLTPPYFNIATGRRIEATDTCGEGVERPELYCKLVGAQQNDFNSDNILIQGQVCDECDPKRPDKAHPPENAIDGSENYWMSPPLSRGGQHGQINLTISLGQVSI